MGKTTRPAPPGKVKTLAAAKELFAKQGYNKTTTQQIADVAGVSQATVFKYYSTKEGLLDAILEEMIGETNTAFFSHLKEVQTVEELAHLVASERLDFFQRFQQEIRILLQEYLTSSAHFQRFNEIAQTALTTLRQALANVRQNSPKFNSFLSDEDVLRTIVGFLGSYVLQGYSMPLAKHASEQLIEKQLLRSLTVD